MKLYLVQHGDALPKEVDVERPLSQRGRGDIERMAAFLGQRTLPLQRIYHSGKLRAQQTAEILGERMRPDLRPERLGGICPDDPAEVLARDIGGWSEDALLVSHQPFLGKLVSCLITAGTEPAVVSFEPGTSVCLERMQGNEWLVSWMLRPRLLSDV